MIGWIFRRAQATVDNAIGIAVARAIVAIPFLIAAAFGVAALQVRLHREFDPEIVNLLLAGVFCVVGIIAFLVVDTKSPTVPASVPADQVAADAAPLEAQSAGDGLKLDLDPQDRELLAAALTSVAPLALPSIMKIVMRNLPALLALAAAIFAMYRLALRDPDQEGTGAAEGNVGEAGVGDQEPLAAQA